MAGAGQKPPQLPLHPRYGRKLSLERPLAVLYCCPLRQHMNYGTLKGTANSLACLLNQAACGGV